MKDSFNEIYFDLIKKSNENLIQEGKFTNSVLAGIAGLGITGGAVLGLNKSSEHSVKNILDKYPSTHTVMTPASSNTSKNDQKLIVNNDNPITINKKQISNNDSLKLSEEEKFIARVLYSETSYKASEQEILMICQIIVNRINNKNFGNGKNAFEVVNVKNAFSCINDEQNLNWEEFKPNLNSRTKLCCKLAKKLMSGEKNFFNDDEIVYYHDKSDLSLWKKWINKYWKPIRLYDTKNFQFYKIIQNNKK